MNVKIVPSKSLAARGTKVYVGNVPISGVTELKLSATADSLWQCSLTVSPEIAGMIAAELVPSAGDNIWAAALAESTLAAIRANSGSGNLQMELKKLYYILQDADLKSSVGAPSWDDHSWPHIFFSFHEGVWVGTDHPVAFTLRDERTHPIGKAQWEFLCHGTCEAGEETFRSRPESDDKGIDEK